MEKDREEIRKVESMLLNVGTLLMSSGASTGRIRTTVNRIAAALGYNVELLITNRTLMLKVSDEDSSEFIASLKRTSPHGVNFMLVSGISRMSWRIVEEQWSVEQINADLKRLVAIPHYPRLLVLVLVAFAGTAFCRIFGGSGYELATAFVATFFGLFIRQESVKKGFNPYLCVAFASFTASIISGIGELLNIGVNPETAFATSVLFLVPGVPLINSFTDLIDGNLLNGITRGVNGMIIAFAIALGLLGAMLILNMN